MKQVSFIKEREPYIRFIETVFEQLPFFVDDTDLKKLNVPTQYEVVMQYLFYMKGNEQAICYEALFSKIEQTIDTMIKRGYEEEWFLHKDSKLLYAIVALAYFDSAEDVIKTGFPKKVSEENIPPKTAKTLYDDYKKLGGKGELANVFRMHWIVGHLLRPIQLVIQSIYVTAKMLFETKRRRIVSFSVLAIALICFMTFYFSDQVASAWKTFGFNQAETNGIDSDLEADEMIYLTIVTDGANIRSDANLNADIVATAVFDEMLEFSGIEKADNEGRIWYQVTTPDGELGWISSHIVEAE